MARRCDRATAGAARGGQAGRGRGQTEKARGQTGRGHGGQAGRRPPWVRWSTRRTRCGL